MSKNHSTKLEIEWCIRKIEESIDNYDMKSAKSYAQCARNWNARNSDCLVERPNSTSTIQEEKISE